MRQKGHAAGVGEIGNVYNTSMGKCSVRDHLGYLAVVG
jgi:hypothetical protein